MTKMEKYSTQKRKYVSLLTSGGFKAVFGDEQNKMVIRDVINTLLQNHRHIVDIEYMHTEHSQQGTAPDNKDFRYDFMCRDKEGRFFIVELQRYTDANWFRRCVSYVARMYNMQSIKGREYDIPPVYLIALMDTPVRHKDASLPDDRYIFEYSMYEKISHELLDDTIFIIFAELCRFNKTWRECRSDLDRMCYLIKNSEEIATEKPAWMEDNELLGRLLEACDTDNFDKEKLIKYQKDMYDEAGRLSELNTARAEGKVEGKAEGKAEERAAIIRKMLLAGMQEKEIAGILGIPLEECHP